MTVEYVNKRTNSRTMLLNPEFWIISNCEFFQYCDSNIGLFFIAPPLVIVLPTIAPSRS